MGAIFDELAARGGLGLRRLEAPRARREQVERVHSIEHIERIERLSRLGGGAIDADTPVGAGSFRAALHAAGGAAHLVDLLCTGGASTGMCCLRPPGHHASAAVAAGFCLFNNVAVAARQAHAEHGLDRVLIVDWDVHHGNGTNDIFAAGADVLYASVHQSPLYPGSGPITDIGHGAGSGYTLNLPVPAGSGDDLWCSLIEHVVAPVASAYRPQLILVSAGYDGHRDDPLAGCAVSEDGFAAMAGSVRRLAERAGAPVGMVLEGGYELGALARSVAATLEVLVAHDAPADPGLAVHPASRAVAAALRGTWPQLSAV